MSKEEEEELTVKSLLAPSVINVPKFNFRQTSSFEISKAQSEGYTFGGAIDIQFMNEKEEALMPATSVGLYNLFIPITMYCIRNP